MKTIKGNIFNSGLQTIVNPVNCVGAMGKGLALQYRNKYPGMYAEYTKHCRKGLYRPGTIILYKDYSPQILNFATKDHFISPSRLEFIEAGLKAFVEQYGALGITSIAFPMLGCGEGGLSGKKVLKLMSLYLDPLPIKIHIYESRYNF